MLFKFGLRTILQSMSVLSTYLLMLLRLLALINVTIALTSSKLALVSP